MLRNLTGVKKIGHAGTLDPLATGLLILATGKKTKEIDKYQAQEKTYTGTITPWGKLLLLWIWRRNPIISFLLMELQKKVS
jgi:hypothetical protein